MPPFTGYHKLHLLRHVVLHHSAAEWNALLQTCFSCCIFLVNHFWKDVSPVKGNYVAQQQPPLIVGEFTVEEKVFPPQEVWKKWEHEKWKETKSAMDDDTMCRGCDYRCCFIKGAENKSKQTEILYILALVCGITERQTGIQLLSVTVCCPRTKRDMCSCDGNKSRQSGQAEHGSKNKARHTW